MYKELATSTGIILFCCALIAQAIKLPKPRFEALGPAFLPVCVLSVIIALSLLHMLTTWLKHRKQRPAVDGKVQKQDRILTIVLPIVAVCYFAAYTLLIAFTDIPYLALTFVFMLLGSWTLAFFRLKTLPVITAVSAGMTAFIYVLFGIGMQTIFP